MKKLNKIIVTFALALILILPIFAGGCFAEPVDAKMGGLYYKQGLVGSNTGAVPNPEEWYMYYQLGSSNSFLMGVSEDGPDAFVANQQNSQLLTFERTIENNKVVYSWENQNTGDTLKITVTSETELVIQAYNSTNGQTYVVTLTLYVAQA